MSQKTPKSLKDFKKATSNNQNSILNKPKQNNSSIANAPLDSILPQNTYNESEHEEQYYSQVDYSQQNNFYNQSAEFDSKLKPNFEQSYNRVEQKDIINETLMSEDFHNYSGEYENTKMDHLATHSKLEKGD